MRPIPGKVGLVLLGAVVIVVFFGVRTALDPGGERGGPDPSRSSERAQGAQEGAGGVGRPGRSGSGDRGEGAVTSPEQVTVPEQPGGGVPVGEVDIRIKEGRTNGQREFARDFVAAAYGYSGSDGTEGGGPAAEEYLGLVGERVDPDTFFDSPGGAAVRERAQGFPDGSSGAAALEAYTILYGPAVGEPVPTSVVEGYAGGGGLPSGTLSGATLAEASYAVGAGYAEPGQVAGDVRYYTQRLLLEDEPTAGSSSRWRVVAAGARQRIEDPDAGAPAPSAPKVGEPGAAGPGGETHSHGPGENGGET